jgi:hypothetical protein
MQWLENNGCPWDKSTFSESASNGNLENMKWLHENEKLSFMIHIPLSIFYPRIRNKKFQFFN